MDMRFDTKRSWEDSFRFILRCRGYNVKSSKARGDKVKLRTITILKKNQTIASYNTFERKDSCIFKQTYVDDRELTSKQADAIIGFKLSTFPSLVGKAVKSKDGQCTGRNCFNFLHDEFYDEMVKCAPSQNGSQTHQMTSSTLSTSQSNPRLDEKTPIINNVTNILGMPSSSPPVQSPSPPAPIYIQAPPATPQPMVMSPPQPTPQPYPNPSPNNEGTFHVNISTAYEDLLALLKSTNQQLQSLQETISY